MPFSLLHIYVCTHACLCVQVQAVSEWGAATGVGTYGEWANVSVYPDFSEELPASGGVCV